MADPDPRLYELPRVSLIVPLYELVRSAGLLDTYTALVLV